MGLRLGLEPHGCTYDGRRERVFVVRIPLIALRAFDKAGGLRRLVDDLV